MYNHSSTVTDINNKNNNNNDDNNNNSYNDNVSLREDLSKILQDPLLQSHADMILGLTREQTTAIISLAEKDKNEKLKAKNYLLQLQQQQQQQKEKSGNENTDTNNNNAATTATTADAGNNNNNNNNDDSNDRSTFEELHFVLNDPILQSHADMILSLTREQTSTILSLSRQQTSITLQNNNNDDNKAGTKHNDKQDETKKKSKSNNKSTATSNKNKEKKSSAKSTSNTTTITKNNNDTQQNHSQEDTTEIPLPFSSLTQQDPEVTDLISEPSSCILSTNSEKVAGRMENLTPSTRTTTTNRSDGNNNNTSINDKKNNSPLSNKLNNHDSKGSSKKSGNTNNKSSNRVKGSSKKSGGAEKVKSSSQQSEPHNNCSRSAHARRKQKNISNHPSSESLDSTSQDGNVNNNDSVARLPPVGAIHVNAAGQQDPLDSVDNNNNNIRSNNNEVENVAPEPTTIGSVPSDATPVLEARLATDHDLSPQVEDLIRRVQELEEQTVVGTTHRQLPVQQQQSNSEVVRAELIEQAAYDNVDRTKSSTNNVQATSSGSRRSCIIVVAVVCFIVVIIIIVVVVIILAGNGDDGVNNNIDMATPTTTSFSPTISPPTQETPTIIMFPVSIMPSPIVPTNPPVLSDFPGIVPTIIQPPISQPSPVTPPSNIVSIIDGDDLRQHLEALYNDNANVASRLFQDSTTIEHQAFKFLSTDLSLIQSQTDLIQRYVLAMFTYSTEWDYPQGWLIPNLDVCNWIIGDSSDVEVRCDSAMEINYLKFRHQYMPGYIPSEIGLLTQLTRLIVAQNTFVPPGLNLVLPNEEEFDFPNDTRRKLRTNNNNDKISNGFLRRQIETDCQLSLLATIPTEIGKLTRLKHLEFEWNVMGGRIPSEIGNLSEILNLELEHNFFTGSLPNEIYNIVGIRRFRLGFNLLNGTISQDIQKMDFMRILSLPFNSFEGTLPFLLDPPMYNLRQIDLSFNKLVGNAQDYLGSSLTNAVKLEGNQFTGSIVNFPCQVDGNSCNLSTDCLGEINEVECNDCSVCCNDVQCCGTQNNNNNNQECYTVDNLWRNLNET